jgi:TolB protein
LSYTFFMTKLHFKKWLPILLVVGLGCGKVVGQKMLITSVRTGDTEIFVVDAATGDAFNVSKAPNSEERYPAWSPDGQRVVFTSNREDGKTYNLYMSNADGSGFKKMTNLPAGSVVYWASWTANGQHIYFNEGTTSMICRVNADGTGFRQMAEGRDGNVSADGKKIVFTQKGANGFGVWTMNTDGTDRRQVVSQESQIGGIAPVWSANGQKIAFSGQVNNFAEIFVCNADGSDLKQLTNLKQISSSPAFSPDGQFLTFRVTDEAYWRDQQKMKQAYQEKAGDKRPVWTIKADGSAAKVVEVLRYQCAIDGSRAEIKP